MKGVNPSVVFPPLVKGGRGDFSKRDFARVAKGIEI